jgi:hypothetical protein
MDRQVRVLSRGTLEERDGLVAGCVVHYDQRGVDRLRRRELAPEEAPQVAGRVVRDEGDGEPGGLRELAYCAIGCRATVAVRAQ